MQVNLDELMSSCCCCPTFQSSNTNVPNHQSPWMMTPFPQPEGMTFTRCCSSFQIYIIQKYIIIFLLSCLYLHTWYHYQKVTETNQFILHLKTGKKLSQNIVLKQQNIRHQSCPGELCTRSQGCEINRILISITILACNDYENNVIEIKRYFFFFFIGFSVELYLKFRVINC